MSDAERIRNALQLIDKAHAELCECDGADGAKAAELIDISIDLSGSLNRLLEEIAHQITTPVASPS